MSILEISLNSHGCQASGVALDFLADIFEKNPLKTFSSFNSIVIKLYQGAWIGFVLILWQNGKAAKQKCERGSIWIFLDRFYCT